MAIQAYQIRNSASGAEKGFAEAPEKRSRMAGDDLRGINIPAEGQSLVCKGFPVNCKAVLRGSLSALTGLEA